MLPDGQAVAGVEIPAALVGPGGVTVQKLRLERFDGQPLLAGGDHEGIDELLGGGTLATPVLLLELDPATGVLGTLTGHGDSLG